MLPSLGPTQLYLCSHTTNVPFSARDTEHPPCRLQSTLNPPPCLTGRVAAWPAVHTFARVRPVGGRGRAPQPRRARHMRARVRVWQRCRGACVCVGPSSARTCAARRSARVGRWHRKRRCAAGGSRSVAGDGGRIQDNVLSVDAIFVSLLPSICAYLLMMLLTAVCSQ